MWRRNLAGLRRVLLDALVDDDGDEGMRHILRWEAGAGMYQDGAVEHTCMFMVVRRDYVTWEAFNEGSGMGCCSAVRVVTVRRN